MTISTTPGVAALAISPIVSGPLVFAVGRAVPFVAAAAVVAAAGAAAGAWRAPSP